MTFLIDCFLDSKDRLVATRTCLELVAFKPPSNIKMQLPLTLHLDQASSVPPFPPSSLLILKGRMSITERFEIDKIPADLTRHSWVPNRDIYAISWIRTLADPMGTCRFNMRDMWLGLVGLYKYSTFGLFSPVWHLSS